MKESLLSSSGEIRTDNAREQKSCFGCFTIIKGIHQLAGVDLCPPDEDVVQSPLCPVGAGHHDPAAEGEGLPPAQARGVGQGVLGEQDVVVPH